MSVPADQESRPGRVLVVGPAWIGDMVMAQSLFKLLRRRRPDVEIDVVAPPWSRPVLGRMPEVREALPLAVAHGQLGLAARRRLARSLSGRGYEHAIVLPRSWKSALVPYWAGVPRRTGFRTGFRYRLLNDLRDLDRARLDQTVKRFLALGLEPGEPLPEPPAPSLRTDRARLAALRRRFGLAKDAIALMPGAAYGPAKQWPLSYFAEVASATTAGGTQVWVLGGPDEHAAAEEIRAAGGSGVLNLCGATRLEDAVDLLSAAAAAVTNDSGLMHVAAAAGTRVIAIYGSSSPAYTPPLSDRAQIVYLGLGCSPCFRRSCPLGHLNCLREIRPARVLDLLSER